MRGRESIWVLLSALAACAAPAVRARDEGRAEGPGAPAGEVRAIWVTRWDYRTEADVRRIVENVRALGLNRIYFQVRGRADAFYRSEIEPWGEELGGRDPGFDPLDVALDASRARGIELHAWMNVLAGWKGTKPPRDRRHLVHARPEWFLLDRGGKRYVYDEHYTMLNPCLTEVRAHIARVAADIARRYAIDGLHLDYIRFVFPDAKDRQAVPYDNATLHIFRRETGGFPSRYPREWDEFRRRAVHTVVHDIQRAVREARPGCPISAAVIRDLERGREVFLQDSPTWLREGWIDEVVPMEYTRDARELAKTIRKDQRLSAREKLIPGLGVYLYKSADELVEQVKLCRELEAPGYSLFAYASFFPTPSHASTDGPRAEELRRGLREALRRLNRNVSGASASGAAAAGASASSASASGTSPAASPPASLRR